MSWLQDFVTNSNPLTALSSSDRNSIARPSTIRDTGLGSAPTLFFKPIDSDQCYESIKAQCVRKGVLWEDPDFPAVKESLFYDTPPEVWPNVQWRRPQEICDNPQLYVGGASKLDINQGLLGDCWLLAATASLSMNQTLMAKVIPDGQSFQDRYAGIFRFHFWQYGRWVEVLIDDRLPTSNGELIYMHSTERDEFWSALIEKAYAKLSGSYEALSGGLNSEALTDFTGGIVKRFELGDKAPKELWQIMLKAMQTKALMGAGIMGVPGSKELIRPNGLAEGHAYTVTDVREVQVNTSQVPGKFQLVRIRNPWGNEVEWKGAWSDGSPEWQAVSEEEKKAVGLTFANDGEYWMTFNDFVNNYDLLEICFLGPDSVTDNTNNATHQCALIEGSWKRKVNAGGCRENKSTFWTNPQYHVKVVDADPDDKDGTGSLIIGLMQKNRRKLYCKRIEDLMIGYEVYKLPTEIPGRLGVSFFQSQSPVAEIFGAGGFREVCEYHKLEPGDYVVVPMTSEPDQDGDFVLRVYSESKTNVVRELDNTTSSTPVQNSHDLFWNEVVLKKRGEDKRIDEAQQAFTKLAGPNGHIDVYELNDILNRVFIRGPVINALVRIFRKESKRDFSTDLTSSMVALYDVDLTGKLGFEDFKSLCSDIFECEIAFYSYVGAYKSDVFASYHLRSALNALGYKVSNAMFNAIVVRYSDKDGGILFNDFLTIYIKLRTIFAALKRKDAAVNGRANFDVEEIAMLTMYS